MQIMTHLFYMARPQRTDPSTSLQTPTPCRTPEAHDEKGLTRTDNLPHNAQHPTGEAGCQSEAWMVMKRWVGHQLVLDLICPPFGPIDPPTCHLCVCQKRTCILHPSIAKTHVPLVCMLHTSYCCHQGPGAVSPLSRCCLAVMLSVSVLPQCRRHVTSMVACCVWPA